MTRAADRVVFSGLARPNALRTPGERPRVLGHRGAPGSFGIPPSQDQRRAALPEEQACYGPENTMASFERAVALGADIIELDVRLCRSGEVVVIHDQTVDRTTDGRGAVLAFDLVELRRLDAGGWFGPGFAGERIPTLAEVLDWATGRVLLDIELKLDEPGQQALVEGVASLLNEYGPAHRHLVTSFDHDSLAAFKQRCPWTMTGLLYAERLSAPLARARHCSAAVLLPRWPVLRRTDVVAAHRQGLAVAPWVSSDPAVWQRLLAMGVDAIGTNHPDRLHTLLAVAP